MSAELKLKALAGGGLTLQVDDTLATDETMNISDGGIVTVTNANGTAVKFPDGTMICSGVTVLTVSNAAVGSLYYQSVSTANIFPVPFVGDLPNMATTVKQGDAGLVFGCRIRDITLSGFGSQIVGATDTASGYVQYQAIGRWK